MLMFNDYMGLLGVSLVCSVILLKGLKIFKCEKLYFPCLFLIIICLNLIKINELSLAGFVRGVTGDFSISSICLSFIWLYQLIFKKQSVNRKSDKFLFILLSAAGLSFYLLSLGVSYFDPYTLGFSSKIMVVALFAITFYCWVCRYYLPVFLVLFAVTAYCFQLLESKNLWDYLIDVWLVLFAVSCAIYQNVFLNAKQFIIRKYIDG